MNLRVYVKYHGVQCRLLRVNQRDYHTTITFPLIDSFVGVNANKAQSIHFTVYKCIQRLKYANLVTAAASECAEIVPSVSSGHSTVWGSCAVSIRTFNTSSVARNEHMEAFTDDADATAFLDTFQPEAIKTACRWAVVLFAYLVFRCVFYFCEVLSESM